MKLSSQERADVVEHRIRRAHETWAETQEIIAHQLWYAAANRMYYACYYMTSVLLIHYGHVISTHTGVIRMLGLHFVKTGLVSKEMGHFYGSLYEFRQQGDYDDFFEITEDDVVQRAEKVETYLQTLESLIRNDSSGSGKANEA